MKKTAMQQLIDIIKSSKQEADVQGVGICEVLDYHGIEDKATELLEKEREQIEDSHNAANINWSAGSPTPITDGYTYYKDTYK